jgi:hypothetical protein
VLHLSNIIGKNLLPEVYDFLGMAVYALTLIHGYGIKRAFFSLIDNKYLMP